MEKKRIAYLHDQYLKSSLSRAELQEWHAILKNAENEQLLSEMMDENWDKMTANDRIHLNDGRSAAILAFINAQPQKNTIKLRRKLRIAAAPVFIGFIVCFFIVRYNSAPQYKSEYVNEVQPGKQGATLTLANGKKIKLSNVSNGEIIEEAGITINKTSKGELIYEVKDVAGDPNSVNILSTSKGETYVLTLPDKSRVWMNAASSLTYPATLKQGGVRKVKLRGEAYFEIAKDASHPFVVETNGQQIEVLGTHFNVNCYGDEPVTKTTLLEGSVKVRLASSGKTIMLKPGEQSLLSNGNIQLQTVDADESIAWKNGYFQFDGKNLETALLEVSRWYNVEIEYKDNSLRKLPVAGSISKYENVQNVLTTMQLTGLLNLSLAGRKVIVEKNN